MSRPAHPAAYADRLVDCEFALDSLFEEMLNQALAAGWEPAETCVAICSLADHQMLKTQAKQDISQWIAETLRTRRSTAPHGRPHGKKRN